MTSAQLPGSIVFKTAQARSAAARMSLITSGSVALEVMLDFSSGIGLGECIGPAALASAMNEQRSDHIDPLVERKSLVIHNCTLKGPSSRKIGIPTRQPSAP